MPRNLLVSEEKLTAMINMIMNAPSIGVSANNLNEFIRQLELELQSLNAETTKGETPDGENT